MKIGEDPMKLQIDSIINIENETTNGGSSEDIMRRINKDSSIVPSRKYGD